MVLFYMFKLLFTNNAQTNQKEELFMEKLNNQESNKSMAFTESKSLRNETIENTDYDFMDKFKVIPYLTDDMILSISQVANYYDVSRKTIETIISRNREEFELDGIIVLRGEDFKDFVNNICDLQNEGDKIYDNDSINSKTRSITLVPKRSLLRVGMILTNNFMATKIRNYLLNIEEKTEIDRKSWAIQREVGIIERKRMTSAISKYIPENKNKKFAYPNYTNMVYKTIFGCDAKSLRLQRNVKTNDALRDNFTESELKKVEEVETIVTGLISMDFTYKQIEEMLKQRYKKKIS